MNKKNICDIGIKVIGLWLLSIATPLAALVFAAIMPGGFAYPLWILVTQVLILLAIALCMFKWSGAMAAFACGSSGEHDDPKRSLRHVFFSLAGVFMLAIAAAQFAKTVWAFQWKRESGERSGADPWTNVVDMAARLVLGIFLVLVAGVLARLSTRPAANKEATSQTD
ncbi:MAG: hypothetical protein HQ592_11050 [Planctomycetes bacterium]|nr:hypothetical protein [Planctomycetota bacterium]